MTASQNSQAEHFRSQIDQQIDNYLSCYLQTDYFQLSAALPNKATFQQALSEVLKPMQKLIFLPGKRWRPALCLLHALKNEQTTWQKRLQSPECRELLGPLVAMVELVHNATLVADDIEDGGQLRRGIPALHLAAPAGYGINRALNACNWAYFAAASLLRPLQNAKPALHALGPLYIHAMHQLHLGQALDIGWHRQNDYIPSIDEYLCMAKLKTGVLAGFAAHAGSLAGAELWGGQKAQIESYRDLWQRIGCAFQVLDDLLNFTIGNPGKLRGDDWLEGKKSFPICVFVDNAQEWRERLAFIIELQQQAQQAAELQNRQDSNNANIETLQAVLEDILSTFQNAEGGRQALLNSANWLKDELEACSTLAKKLYQKPYEFDQAPAQYLLYLLAKLKKQTQFCLDSLQ